MKALGCVLLAMFPAGCGSSAPETDPALDLLGDVVRSVRLAETEIHIWSQEVAPLRTELAGDPAAEALFRHPKPTSADVRAIGHRVELLVSSLPRRPKLEVLQRLARELDRADAAVSAYRGPRNRIFAIAEARARARK